MKRRTIRVGGVDVIVRDSGSDGPVLVALHGYPDTGRIFERLAGALGDMRVVAPDWPGQGESAVRPDVLGPTARGAWVRDVLDVLGIERAVIFAHDMGALPALAVARDHASRVERVFVANALLSNDAPTSLAIRVLRKGRVYRVVLPAMGPIVFARCVATFLDAPLEPELEADLRWCFVRPSALSTVARACAAYDAELPAFMRTLTNVAAPVHALWSRRGEHFPIAHAHALRDVVTGASIDEVSGGHWMVHERAESVAALVRATRRS